MDKHCSHTKKTIIYILILNLHEPEEAAPQTGVLPGATGEEDGNAGDDDGDEVDRLAALLQLGSLLVGL